MEASTSTNTSALTIRGVSTKTDPLPLHMSNTFMEKIKCLPIDVQYTIFELFGKMDNYYLSHNKLIKHIIEQFNTMDLSETDDEFKEYFVSSGLKMLSDELCFMFVSTNAKDDYSKICLESMTYEEMENYEIKKKVISELSQIPTYIINRNVLLKYFQIMMSVITTLDIEVIKNILLDIFEQYDHLSVNDDKQVSVSYLRSVVFNDDADYKLTFSNAETEQRSDRFKQCLGTIVLSVDIVTDGTCYYLIFDVLTKKIFMYNCADYRDDDTLEITTDDFSITLEKSISDTDDTYMSPSPSPSPSTHIVKTELPQSSFVHDAFTLSWSASLMFITLIVLVLDMIFVFYGVKGIIKVSTFAIEYIIKKLEQKFGFLNDLELFEII